MKSYLGQYMVLFANCKAVKGACRSTICDLQTNEYFLIPNTLYKILGSTKEQTVNQILERYSDHKSTILEYIEFLEEKKLVYFVDDPSEILPELPMTWDYPAAISNTIIDVSISNIWFIEKYIANVEKLGCRFFQLRIFNKDISNSMLFNLLDMFSESSILGIDLVLPFEKDFDTNQFTKYPRLMNVTFHSAPEQKNIVNENLNVVYIEHAYNEKSCGAIHPTYFFADMQTFTEAQNHNTCLNRKVSLDKDGFIKNCPSMTQHFGHISKTNIEDILENSEFTKYWNISKDEIKKCNICEFRYVCTDCRAYLENPEDLYSAPLKCEYDPEKAEWEDSTV